MVKGKKRGKKQIYPWANWLSRKKETTLIKGRDYLCTTESMLVMLRTKAVSINKSIQTTRLIENKVEGLKYKLYERN